MYLIGRSFAISLSSCYKCLNRVSFTCYPKIPSKTYVTFVSQPKTNDLVKDVILFRYENPKFFKLISIFGLVQFFFWSYLGEFAMREMRDAPVEEKEKENEELPWWRKVNLGENKYRNGLTAVCLLFGFGILAVSWTYTLKSVRYLILNKGGEKISFVTYTPFGRDMTLTVPLTKVTCSQSRTSARTTLPIKVQNKALYYMLDMRGEFRNPQLFDYTAGLKRKFK